MNCTQGKISEFMINIANSENGTNLLLQMTLNAFMKSDRFASVRKSKSSCSMLSITQT